jgi:hypothetical protein
MIIAENVATDASEMVNMIVINDGGNKRTTLYFSDNYIVPLGWYYDWFSASYHTMLEGFLTGSGVGCGR